MDEAEEKGGFKVTDRRRFTEEGEAKQEPDVKEEASAPDEARETPPRDSAPKTDALPPIDFSSFVLSLANTALFQLGLIRTRESEEMQTDLPGARQTIDIMAMLEEKTRGNLTDQEARLLKEALFQTRMAFVEVAK
jgi:hypothetical protein